MGEFLAISSIDANIHFGYQRRSLSTAPLISEARNRLIATELRIREIALDHTRVFFDFSAYVEQSSSGILTRATKVTNDPAYHEEVERIQERQTLLGSQYFLFGTWEKPTLDQFKSLFSMGGYTYNPKTTQLSAYGEWLGACVDIWKNHIKKTLGLTEDNCRIDTDLSTEIVCSPEYEKALRLDLVNLDKLSGYVR